MYYKITKNKKTIKETILKKNIIKKKKYILNIKLNKNNINIKNST